MKLFGPNLKINLSVVDNERYIELKFSLGKRHYVISNIPLELQEVDYKNSSRWEMHLVLMLTGIIVVYVVWS